MDKRNILLTAITLCICIALTGCMLGNNGRGKFSDKDVKIEFDNLTPIDKSAKLEMSVDKTASMNWSVGKGVIVSPSKIHQYFSYEIPAPDDRARTFTFYGIRNKSFGTYRLAISNRPTGKTIDFYGDRASSTGPVELGTFKPKDGKFIILFVVVGSNAESTGSKYGAGFDYIVLSKPLAK